MMGWYGFSKGYRKKYLERNIHSIRSRLWFITATDNYYVNWESGEIGAVNGFVVTDYLEIKPSVEYMTDAQYNQQFAFYDENKVSAYLLIPYLLWIIFASILNLIEIM